MLTARVMAMRGRAILAVFFEGDCLMESSLN